MADTVIDYGMPPNLSRLFKGNSNLPSNRVNPMADACRVQGGHKIFMELPGVAVADVSVVVSDGVVVVAGRKTMHAGTEGSTWFFRESELGSFRREFRVPKEADLNKIEVILQDGLLRIYLPDLEKTIPQIGAEIVELSARRNS